MTWMNWLQRGHMWVVDRSSCGTIHAKQQQGMMREQVESNDDYTLYLIVLSQINFVWQELIWWNVAAETHARTTFFGKLTTGTLYTPHLSHTAMLVFPRCTELEHKIIDFTESCRKLLKQNFFFVKWDISHLGGRYHQNPICDNHSADLSASCTAPTNQSVYLTWDISHVGLPNELEMCTL